MLELDDALIGELSELAQSIYKFFDSPNVLRQLSDSEPTPTQGIVLVFDGAWFMPHRIYGSHRVFGTASHMQLDTPRYLSFLDALKARFVVAELTGAEAAGYCDGEAGPVVRLVERKPAE